MLEGEIVMSGASAGILCRCCGKIVSCSQFEGHAGYGTRRNPYDNIRTERGASLKELATRLPPLPEDLIATPHLARKSSGKKKSLAIGAGEIGACACAADLKSNWFALLAVRMCC